MTASLIRTYRCVICVNRFKTHADLEGKRRICPACVVRRYKPPPPPVRQTANPSRTQLKRHKLTTVEYWRSGHPRTVPARCCSRGRGFPGPRPYVVDHNHETLQRAIDYLTTKGHYAGRNIRATLAKPSKETA